MIASTPRKSSAARDSKPVVFLQLMPLIRQHARESFRGLDPEARSSQSVVHPGRLSRERLMDLCSQCHRNALRDRGPAFSYRPGESLDAHVKTLTTRRPEDDHVANQTTYLRESKCFQKSDTLTCVTCHNPHEATKLSDRGVGQSACLECHQVAECGERAKLPGACKATAPAVTCLADEKSRSLLKPPQFPIWRRSHTHTHTHTHTELEPLAEAIAQWTVKRHAQGTALAM